MKLTVYGATGATGRHVVEQALAAGHEVTAVVRDRTGLDVRGERLTVTEAPIGDPAPLHGADAVISCIGPRSAKDAGICAPITRSIVEAMQAAEVRRIVVISAAPVSTTPSPGRPNPPKDPGENLTARLIKQVITLMFGRHYKDLALMEDVLRECGLDWTSCRPGRLTDRPLTGRYRTAIDQSVPGGLSISRADTAHAMLWALDRPETIKAALHPSS